MAYNYIAILSAAIASFLLGWIWYGPLFGKCWMKLVKMTPAKAKKQNPGKSMIIGFITYLIMAMILSLFVKGMGSTGVIGGMWIGLLVWVGFVFTIQMGIVLWEGKPMQLFAVNAGYQLASLVLMGAILGAF